MIRLLDGRATRLLMGLAAFFCLNAVLAEFIGERAAECCAQAEGA